MTTLFEGRATAPAARAVSDRRMGIEIIRDVLSAVGASGKKTHIMYAAKLSHEMTKRYLEHLEACALIALDPDEPRYALTARGHECLAQLAKVMPFVSLPENSAPALWHEPSRAGPAGPR